MKVPLDATIHAGKAERFGMVIDLNRCVGCQTCTVACKHANDTTPDVQWRRVLDLEFGQFPDVQRLFMVTGCQHCAEPPCVPVCPTGATFAREDGLVVMQYDDCLGCGYCAVACPYQARTIAHEQRGYFATSGGKTTAQEMAVRHPQRRGVAQKCTFCMDRIDDAKATGAVPGVDPEATPACSSACIAQAIHFGDFADEASNVSTLLAENQLAQMHGGLGTEPQIRYLLDTPAVSPRDHGQGIGAAGPLQTFWDARASLNFILGGMSTGFIVIAFVSWLFAAMDSGSLGTAYVIGACGMLAGLTSVFFEIGRKARSLYVFRRVATSWMSREAWAAVALLVFVALDWRFDHLALHVIVAISATFFLYCQARILDAGRGIPAWRVREIRPLIVASGLLEGAGLFAILAAIGIIPVSDYRPVGILAIIVAVVSASLWHRYIHRARSDFAASDEPVENRFSEATRAALTAVRWPVHIVAHGVPLVSIVVAAAVASLPDWLLLVAGGTAVCGGALWKFTVITRAAHHQGFTLPRLPGRGSGQRAAPRRQQFTRPAPDTP